MNDTPAKMLQRAIHREFGGRNGVLRECAKLADAEYNEQARLAALHKNEGDYEAMDRRNAAAVSASRIAAAIRNLMLE